MEQKTSLCGPGEGLMSSIQGNPSQPLPLESPAAPQVWSGHVYGTCLSSHAQNYGFLALAGARLSTWLRNDYWERTEVPPTLHFPWGGGQMPRTRGKASLRLPRCKYGRKDPGINSERSNGDIWKYVWLNTRGSSGRS